jgi:hypothetical protein
MATRPTPVPHAKPAPKATKSTTPETDSIMASQKAALTAILAKTAPQTDPLRAQITALQAQIDTIEGPDVKSARKHLAILNNLSASN